MPNKHSKAGHIPIRTCVVCRQRSAKIEFLPFILLPAGIVYDLAGNLQRRKFYHCYPCLQDLPKWRKRRHKSKGRSL